MVYVRMCSGGTWDLLNQVKSIESDPIDSIHWPDFLLSLMVILFFLLLGIDQFRKMEKTFGDLI